MRTKAGNKISGTSIAVLYLLLLPQMNLGSEIDR